MIVIGMLTASSVLAAMRQEKSVPAPPKEENLPEAKVVLDGKVIFSVKGKVFPFRWLKEPV